MHLSVITEAAIVTCCVCGKLNRGVRLHVFSNTGHGKGPMYCAACLFQIDRTSSVELEEPEVENEGRAKSMRAQKKRSREQELELAEELGAKVQKASGALSGSKGDVRKKGEVRLEAKYTEAASYTLKLEDLHKILSECVGKEKAVFVIDFVEKMTKRLKDRYAVVPFEDLKELMDAARQPRRP